MVTREIQTSPRGNARSSAGAGVCWRVSLLIISVLTLFAASVTGAQSLTNGWDQAAALLLNTTNSYTFYATNGDTLHLRAGAPDFRPLITLHAPNGSALGTGWGSGSSSRDAWLDVTATTNGLFTVRVSNYYRNAPGAYSLSLARIPAEFELHPADQGGALTNGAARSGDLALGDIDMWTFDANAGSAILVRVGTSGFRPLLHVYGPRGEEMGVGFGAQSSDTEALAALAAPATGTYTILVQGYYANATGAYRLNIVKPGSSFAVADGDESGLLGNGVSQPGSIIVGDLDLWMFEAVGGEPLTVRVGSPEFRPSLRIYGPSGKLLQEAGGTSSDNDALVSIITTNSGFYTAVVQSYYYNQTSSYRINLARVTSPFSVSPGDEGGILTNGLAHVGTNKLGDIELYTFIAFAGDNIALRIGAPDYRPSLALHGPDGRLLQTAAGVSSTRDASISLQLTNTGIYTLIAQSYYLGGSGPYSLNFSRLPAPFTTSPGDEGGPISNALPAMGAITLGDQDLWSFGACANTTFRLSCENLTGTWSPRMRLYAPNGALLTTAENASVATITRRATKSGRYFLLIDGGAANQTGTYRVVGMGVQEDALTLCPPVLGENSLSLSGYGGTPAAPVIVLSTTNAALPRNEWVPLSTNTFDGLGGFEQTRPLGLENVRYFMLRLP